MSTLTMDLSSTEGAIARKASSRSIVRLVLGISILSGPFAYLICRTVNAGFGGENQGLAVAGFFVVGFELVWIGYGAVALLAKGLRT